MTGTKKDPATISTLPPEVQHLIVSHLDVSSLFRLLLTCRQYQNIVSTECQSVWKAHHDERWKYGKLFPKRFRDAIIGWSKTRGWAAHRASGPQIEHVLIEGNWFDEYLYRSKVDMMALRYAKSLTSEASDGNEKWRELMRQREDIIDVCKKMDYAAVLRGLDRYMAYEEWRFLHEFSGNVNIEDGAIAISKFFMKRDDHDLQRVNERLDGLADWLKETMQQRFGQSTQTDIETLYPIRDILVQMGYLFGAPASTPEDNVDRPFQGNSVDYYHPANSMINLAIARRTGIPITLAVIYIAIVRRAFNIELDVIGLPGHIVIGVPQSLGAGQIFVDPFNAGRILSYNECRQIVTRYNITFHDEMLIPISYKAVWQRMISNLIYVHTMIANNIADSWDIVLPLNSFLPGEMQNTSNFDELFSTQGWSYHREI